MDQIAEIKACLKSQIELIERGSGKCSCGAIPESDHQESLRSIDEQERAFRKIERLSCMREQASEQLRRRLTRDGFEASSIELALSRAQSCGLVDDLRFAEILMRCRLAAGRGRQGIETELSHLGIDASLVEEWPEGFPVSEEEEVERGLQLLDRNPPHAKNKREAAYRRLTQKGFGSSVSSTAARLWTEKYFSTI